MAKYTLLLPNTKLPEDIPEHLVGGDFAGDGAEMVKDFAEILGDEVGRGVGGEAGADEGEGARCSAQSVVVAGVCNQRRAGGTGRNAGVLQCDELVFQLTKAKTGLCGNKNHIILTIRRRNNFR